ncbi:MAG TPA: Calx-beta domain-containing protein, partial [Azospirillaceae bacterium]|nr:Calx-beta domain-containing protein [Azospirillaceae bacterium]
MPTIDRVSLADDESQSSGGSRSAAVSANGRYVAFVSDATNLLTTSDTNTQSDVFLRDTTTGTTVRLSVSTAGVEGNGACYSIAVSADGRYVAYASDASTLVTDDTNALRDVFVRDTVGNTTTRLSVGGSGAQSNGVSDTPSISADGRYVVFASTATNLVTGDTNGQSDVFVRDTLAGTTTRLSVAGSGTEGNGASDSAALSADGRYVVFASTATNLVTGDTNGQSDVFVRDTLAGTTTRLSVAGSGTEGNGASDSAALSADGRYVVFASTATNLVTDDTNGQRDVFLRDLVGGTISRVSLADDETQGNGATFNPTVAAGGQYVLFASDAFNLVSGDSNGRRDVFVRDTVSGTTIRLSVSNAAAQGDTASVGAAISGDGHYAVFQSDATTLVTDTNALSDIFRVDLGTTSAPLVQIVADNASKSEGDSGTTSYTFIVSRLGLVSAPASFTYTVTGTATNPATAADFMGAALPSGTVTFPANDTSETITIPVAGDLTPESSEGFVVTLTTSDSVKFLNTSATALIAADDGFQIAATDAVKVEGNSAAVTDFTFTVTRSGNVSTATSVSYAVAGSGINPAVASDFVGGVLPSGVLTFAPGDTSKTITVPVAGGIVLESDETFIVTLSSPTGGATLVTANATGTITNDDSNGIGRLSIASAGTEANGLSFDAAMSADGRHVLFQSYATNLVASDTNNRSDVFVRDTTAGTTSRLSLADDETQGNGASFNAGLSADGRYVVFASDASNLVLGDTNSLADVFLRDTVGASTVRISLAGTGTQGNGRSFSPATSTNGRYVVFASDASNLVTGDTNNQTDVFLRDTVAVTTTRLSAAADSTQGNGASENATISPDGRYVVFASDASNLVTGDTNGMRDVFVRDTAANSIVCLSTGGNGNSFSPSNSADGRYVVFASDASNLVTGDTNGVRDVFVRDTVGGTTTRASLAGDGTQGNGISDQASISADGRYVVFASAASNLVAGDTNYQTDVFVRDTVAGTATRLSLASGGTQGTGPSNAPVISADGRYVAMLSSADNLLVSGDSNGWADVFRVDLGASSTSLVQIAAVAADTVKSEGNPATPTSAPAVTNYTFQVTRVGNLSSSANVAYTVIGSGASAANAADFQGAVLPTGTISFAASDDSETITIPVLGDATIEGDEGFTVTLSNSAGAIITIPSASGTIQSDEPSVSIAASSASAAEGSTGSTNLTFIVTRTNGLSAIASVAYAVTGSGTSPVTADDFTGVALPSGTVSFAVDETTKTITIPVAGDTVGENDEGFTVTLSTPSAGLSIGTATAAGTIQNDDPSLSIATATATKAEGDTGVTDYTFTVTRAGGSSGTASVAYAVTGSGTNAAVAADFTGAILPSGTVSFAAGEAVKTITIPIAGDTVIETDETFTVTLSNASAGLTLATATAIGAIQNDDATLAITATTAAQNEGNSGTTDFTFTVTRSGTTTGATNAAYAVTGSGTTPAVAADFVGGALPSGTVSFAAGETT